MSETFELGPTTLRVVVATPQITVLEAILEPGGGSGWHTHTREDETLLVVEGSLVVDDGESRELHPGEAHVLPRATRHSFANRNETPTRLYFICTPGGLEHFFRDLTSGVSADEAAARAGLVFG